MTGETAIDIAKMASRLISDIVICRVLEDNFRIPEEESSEEETVPLLETDYRP